MAEWFRVVEFRWVGPGSLKMNSIHTHELWAMRDPVGLGFDHEQHRLWREAEMQKDFRAAKRHMMARRPSPGLSEVWKLLGHARKAYALNGRFDCFPAYVDPGFKDGVKALVRYFTKYLTGEDFVEDTWKDWKGKQVTPGERQGIAGVVHLAGVFEKGVHELFLAREDEEPEPGPGGATGRDCRHS